MYAVVYNTDKGKNTKSGFVKYSGHTTSDDPTPTVFSYPNNAQVKGDFLYVRDSNGNILSGHRVDDGDCITVLDVSYSKQLALVQYPTNNGTLEGYVKNATNIIKYFNTDEWHNGSTKEIVYDENGKAIGSLAPYESATPLYRKNGMTAVVYNTDKGKNTKSGFVRYSGNGVYNSPSKSNTPSTSTGTPGKMVASDKLVRFIASYEGFSSTPYRGVDYQNRTIGYGHVILPGEKFTSLTKEEALALLKKDLAKYEKSVNNEFGSILNQNQFDALVSFCYNLGVHVWHKGEPRITRDVKAGASAEQLKTDFTNFCHCGGKYVQGLYNRRLDEWEMFVYADYNRNH